MSPDSFKITIHMVSSLDGFIAKKDNDMSWFNTPGEFEKGLVVTKQDIDEFLKKIDCYVMGSHTYEHALELSKSYGWVYGDIPTIVLSRRELPVKRKNIELYSGSLEMLVNEKLKPSYKNVWLVGGASLASDFMHSNLVDELRHSILPIILGEGIPFFDQLKKEQALHLADVTAYKSGMVELRYEIKK